MANDTTAPTVITLSTVSTPGGITGVGISSDIVLTFSEAVQKGSGLIEIHSGSATGPVVASYDAATSSNLIISGSTLTINPATDLANGTHYFVTLSNGSIMDSAGNAYESTSSYDFTTVAAPDIIPPSVLTFSPAINSSGAAVSSYIVFTFNEAVQRGVGSIAIHSGSATGPLIAIYDAATSTNLTISGSTLAINSTAVLTSGTHYFVTLSNGSVKDLAGNAYAETSSYAFTPDTIAPTLSPFTPATGVAINSDIVLAFSEEIQKGVGAVAIHIGSSVGSVVESYDVATSTNLTISGSTLTINPTSDLANGIHYFVTLSNGSIKDLASNNYAGISAYDFTTVMPPDFSPVSNNSGGVTEVALAGVGVLGFLAWVVF